MLDSQPISRRLRRLHFRLAGTWAAAWILGIGSLALVALRLGEELRRQDLDAQLTLSAVATYGLTWFDGNGRFHDEIWALESDLVDGPVELWVIGPGDPSEILLAPKHPRFAQASLTEVVGQVLEEGEPVTSEGNDLHSAPWRLHAIPTYEEGVSEQPRAVIIAITDPSQSNQAQTLFASKIGLFAALLGAVGIGLGLVLARWSLLPLAAGLQQREHFLVAAAHELRTPVAALLAVCESASAGDESAETALGRAQDLARRTREVVEDLLLLARLDGASWDLELQPLRLDLLVEDVLAEETGYEGIIGEESTATVDSRLVRVAVRNLLRNARLHGDCIKSVAVRVRGTTVIVEDQGPGFPEAMLENSPDRFAFAPSSSGVGIGLAITRLIAELHGGALELTNTPEGGARISLRLGGQSDRRN